MLWGLNILTLGYTSTGTELPDGADKPLGNFTFYLFLSYCLLSLLLPSIFISIKCYNFLAESSLSLLMVLLNHCTDPAVANPFRTSMFNFSNSTGIYVLWAQNSSFKNLVIIGIVHYFK